MIFHKKACKLQCLQIPHIYSMDLLAILLERSQGKVQHLQLQLSMLQLEECLFFSILNFSIKGGMVTVNK